MAENGLDPLRPGEDGAFMTVERNAFLYSHEDIRSQVWRVFSETLWRLFACCPRSVLAIPPR
jgi:hypothetical protein